MYNTMAAIICATLRDASALRTYLDSVGTDILADFGGAQRAQGSATE
jgi:hypothetical protein